MPPADDPERRLSELVGEFAESGESTVSLGELVDHFGGRALAALLLIFGLACALPLPPGATTVFGLPLVLLSPQLVFAAKAPWVPATLRRRRFSGAQMQPVFSRIAAWLKRMEAITRPRLGLLVGGVGQIAIGLVCTVFALVLILPIPLGNMLPAATVSAFSLALIQRDGVVALIGWALAAASVSVLALAAGLIAGMARQALMLVGFS
jgi:hypothetical protein